MEGPEHMPVSPQPAPKSGPSEKVGEDLPEGDFNIPMERASEGAREDSSGFTQAQQFVQALQREEKRQQKKEDELAKMLRGYIQESDNEEFFEILLALLDRNVLASLLVAALTLRDESLVEEMVKLLPAGDSGESGSTPLEPDAEQTSHALQVQFGTNPWDPRVKPRIEQWLFTMRELCGAYPKRLLKDISHENRSADELFQQLLALVMRDFFTQEGLQTDEYQIKVFTEAIVQRLIDQMAQQVNNQKLID